MENVKPPVKDAVRKFTKDYVSEVVKESTKKLIKGLEKEKKTTLEAELKNRSAEEIKRYFDTNAEFNDAFESTIDSINEASLEKIQTNFEEKFSKYLTPYNPTLFEQVAHWIKSPLHAGIIIIITVAVIVALINLNSPTPPMLSVSPDPPSFSFDTLGADTSSSQIFSISNAGGGTLTWGVSTDQPWITADPASGTNSGTVSIKINTTGLSLGSYTGHIIVTSSDGSTKTGTINLNVIPTPSPTPTPTLTTTPTPTPTITPTPTPIPPSLSIFPRIWDQDKKPPVPYMWNVYNFEGFFYDIRDNLGAETLQILQTDLSASQRTIDKNNLVYTSMAQPETLKVATALNLEGDNNGLTAKGLDQAEPGKAFDQGQYYTIGWQGEKYVAVNGRVDKLAMLIIEQGTASSEKKTLSVGETWDVGGGWTLTANSIDTKATPRQVWLTLSKDGVKKDDKVVTSGTTNASPVYTYTEKSIEGETDVPLFVTYVDSIFAGATSDMVQLRYTWAINTPINRINVGDIYGVFRVVALDTNSKSLELRNTDSTITLSQDSTMNLIGNLSFEVADRTDTLRFMPVVLLTQPGDYEIRGAVWNEFQIPENKTQIPTSLGGTGKIAEWNVYNFAGFFYDLNADLGKESLKILQTDLSANQRTIDKNNLVYTSMAQPETLKVATALNLEGDNNGLTANGLDQAEPGKAFDQGQYYTIGWQGEKYVAVNGRVDKLAMLIIEQGTASSEKKTLQVGESWYVGGGWTLTANSIDTKATPRQVWLTLSKDGVKKDDKVVTSGTTNASPIYTYTEKSIEGETDVPLFVTYVDSIFAGATSDMVQLRYTWAINTSINRINVGDSYGVFKVVALDTNSKSLELRNTDSTITLSQDSTVDLMGNLKFKVADNADVLRFYPMETVTLHVDESKVI